jgi:glycosyltransferase involved in cell wall biosynthesis
MIIIVYSAKTNDTIVSSLGAPEYSYYFVLKEFLPVLKKIGKVIVTEDPGKEVDSIYEECLTRDEQCFFLSFTPPDKTTLNFACPTIPVFAWEFFNLPNEAWDDNNQNDWRYVLSRTGWAITHSSFTCATVRKDVRSDYPIISIPAPVWDRFSSARKRSSKAVGKTFNLTIDGRVIDTRTTDLSVYSPLNKSQSAEPLSKCTQTVEINGIVYTSIFNPNDGRKNWHDMVWAFCWAFKDCSDATLVLKLTHINSEPALNALLYDLYKLTPFSCRVIAIDGFLSDTDYESLAVHSSYTVNTSHGEGQCLPLMEYMSCGKPAITPKHTGMNDYINRDNAFIVKSSLEPSHWPQDPRQSYRTLRHRIDWESLLNNYIESYNVAKTDRRKYEHMSKKAIKTLKLHCSHAVAKKKLKVLFDAQARIQREFG